MKCFSLLTKYIVVPVSTVIGLIYGFDMYIIGRAKTVIEPHAVKVDAMIVTMDKIDQRTSRIESILLNRKSAQGN